MTTTTKAMIVSVGGSPEPVILSLNERQPEYVVFFVSRASRPQVREAIEPKLSFRPRDHDIIVTPDEEDLGASVMELMRELPPLFDGWSVPFDEVIGDYTGGTKTMSAAIVLALAERGCHYSYVGGKSRSKDGLGVVISGTERMLYLDNPWDALAVGPSRDAALLFNRCRFMAVRDLAEKTARRTEHHQPFFLALQVLAEGYYAWDNFQYDRALNLLKRGQSQLRGYASASPQPAVRRFFEDVSANLPLLEQINTEFAGLIRKTEKGSSAPQTDTSLVVCDLVANAMRRATLEHKYDDAVARLYSAVEKLAKYRLQVVHGIDNSNVDLERVPEALREELRANCSAEGLSRKTGESANEPGPAEQRQVKIQIPLRKSYQLLYALKDSLGELYMAREVELDKVLGIRNMSLLAHGFQPVGEEIFRKLFAITLVFLGLEAEQLPRFPDLEFKGEGL